MAGSEIKVMWERILNYTITEQKTSNIHEFLKAHGYSSSLIRAIKEDTEGIRLNGDPVLARTLLTPGDQLAIRITETKFSENIVPSDLPLSIVYEDPDLLIIARHLYSASLLSAMMARREIHREYLALATGIIPEDGTITAPIARKEGSTIERMVDFKHGEYACTHYRRISITNTDPVYSLVALKLDTGRTHQIRVHMNYIGHPLPGDFLYNPDYSHISRQALHSHHLRFRHPITGEEMHFTAPVPEDMLL